jgi:oligosaccharide reducing-end xylanase
MISSRRGSSESVPFLVAVLAMCVVSCVPRQSATPATTESALPHEAEPLPTIGPPLAPPTRGAFETGEYRNLFAELGHPPQETLEKIRSGYEQLFHGDPDSEAVMFTAGENDSGKLAYVKDIGNDDIRSEGMSYGMMIAVQMDRKEDFDALWNWARSHMYHAEPTHPCRGFFSWQSRPDGTAMDEMPAPDGEEYFATALLFAAHRWGNGEGIYDYKAQALQLLSDMKNRESITGSVNNGKRATAVALFHPEHKMVRFTPDTGNFAKNGDHTDPSYHVPAFYELWARWGPIADRPFWTEAAHVSRDFFVKAAHPVTALTPDYANFDGTPKAASWDAGTANFRYDAWRTAMNWAVDAAWWAQDPREQQLSDRLLAFFETQWPNYKSNFTLDGKPINENDSLGLVATNAVAALAATHPRAWHFVDVLYKWRPPKGKWRYYDGMLYLMAMPHVSGQFKIYGPTAPGATSAPPAASPSESGAPSPAVDAQPPNKSSGNVD